jgi:hypothetical protein
MLINRQRNKNVVKEMVIYPAFSSLFFAEAGSPRVSFLGWTVSFSCMLSWMGIAIGAIVVELSIELDLTT